jgi:hypothetical protein
VVGWPLAVRYVEQLPLMLANLRKNIFGCFNLNYHTILQILTTNPWNKQSPFSFFLNCFTIIT